MYFAELCTVSQMFYNDDQTQGNFTQGNNAFGHLSP